MEYRGRLAPSPTGKTHLGHARTYLLAWLRARAAGGSLVMRIEDLDPPRVVEGAADLVLKDLDWLGLDWDDGPLFQSERDELYEEALRTLEARGLVFPCTCSRKEVAAVSSAPHGHEELGVRYPGTCRNGPSHPERDPALRFVFDEAPPFVDVLHGAIDPSGWEGDFILRRADGLWSYQLAVVVDDAAMGVTEVVRGDDLLSSTPRQIGLHRALGGQPPAFLHVPLVVDADGQRLAKRHGAASIESLREAGEHPRAIVGRLAASLGIIDAGVDAAPHELVGALDLDRIPRNAVSI